MNDRYQSRVRAQLDEASLNPSICSRRGHCGPFVNEAFYAAFPGWEKFADCATCGSTVLKRRHLARSRSRWLPVASQPRLTPR